MLAARLVGRYGSVTSVDIDPAALKTLESRPANSSGDPRSGARLARDEAGSGVTQSPR
jgi:hypothetical protein